jgi:hypothetical protein
VTLERENNEERMNEQFHENIFSDNSWPLIPFF